MEIKKYFTDSSKEGHLLRFKIALGIGTMFAIIISSSFTSFAEVCDDIRSDTLRFHILANSDSKQDQALKLKVRDAVLKETNELFSIAGTKQLAKENVAESLKDIEKIAEKEININGYNYKVKAYQTNMYFDTIKYPKDNKGEYTLPAGNYDAVRIEIGKGAGKNWFCVLFPQLCVPAAAGEEKAKSIYSDKEIDVLEGEYEMKFAVVEFFTKLGKDKKTG